MTAFVPLAPIHKEKVKVVLHGKDAPKKTAYLWVKYHQEKLELRPSKEERTAIQNCDSVMLHIQEGIFGIDYITLVEQVKN